MKRLAGLFGRAVVGESCEGLGEFLEMNRQPSIAGVEILVTLRWVWYRDRQPVRSYRF